MLSVPLCVSTLHLIHSTASLTIHIGFRIYHLAHTALVQGPGEEPCTGVTLRDKVSDVSDTSDVPWILAHLFIR